MAPQNSRTLLAALIATALAGAMQPAWAVLPISQQPLVLPTKVKPAFIMSLDNSGSIGSDETLCRTNQGGCYWSNASNSFFDAAGVALESGTDYVRVMRPGNMPQIDSYGAGRDPEFNRAYFNPSNTYTPWVNFDGSPYLGSNADGSVIANFINQVTGNAVLTSAPEDPRHPKTATGGGGGTTFDFVNPGKNTFTVNNAGSGGLTVGDVIAAGESVEYSTTTSILNCTALKTVLTTPTTPANNTMVKLAANFTIPASCATGKITIQWYMATVYLTTNTSAGVDAITGFNYANVITAPGAGPKGTPLYKYEIIPANFANPLDYQTAVQNFANYWTYFADRARAIVGASTQAFEGVDFMRVGNFWISPICTDPNNPNDCDPVGTVGNLTSYVAGPDSAYKKGTNNPAGDPLVPMFDMSDYTYKTGVAINPIPPGGATFSATGGDRFQFYDSIFRFDSPNNNTPTRRSVYRMGHQFMRGPNTSGATPGLSDPNPPVLNACQANAGMLFTDGYINDGNNGLPAVGNVDAGLVNPGGINNNVGNSVTGFGTKPFTDGQSNTMSDIAAYFYQQNLRPDLNAGKVQIATGCPNAQLDCNPNLHMNFFGIPLGARGQFYDIAPYINLPKTTQDEATQAAFTTPPAWAATPSMNLNPADVDDIWHAAINSRGGFISAQSPAAVRDGIRQVIDTLLSAALNSGFLPVVGARLGAGSATYTPSFAVNGTDWSGDLVANAVLTSGATAPGPPLWDAGVILHGMSIPALDARNIWIDTTSGTSAGHVTAQFDGSNFGAFGINETVQLGFFGLNSSTFHALYGPTMHTTELINFLMGDRTNELGTGNGGAFRTRTKILGDIIDSEPTVSVAGPIVPGVSRPDDYGFGGTTTGFPGAGALYDAFLTAKQSRVPATMIYVGANEGMLHAFDGAPASTGGHEQFAFIPNSVASNLGLLVNPDYVHHFYVDGAQTVFDAYVNGGWHTVLVGSTGVGGSGVYALNIDSPGSFSGANVMWEQTAANDPDIGTNVGAPQVILAEDSNWYAAFGNGFNSSNSNPALILVNLATGIVTTKLVGNDGGNFDNGIAQVAALDSDGDGKVDTMYGGDYRGNMWKFDLSSPSPASWTVAFSGQPLYVAKDLAGNLQPITSGIELAPGPLGGTMVYFGTGSFFLASDNTPPTPPAKPPVQSLYGVWDNGTPDTTTSRATTDLGSVSIASQSTASPATRDLSAVGLPPGHLQYDMSSSTLRGFLLDMIFPGTAASGGTPARPAGPDGEKFFGQPRVANGIVFFTTFEPSGDACLPGGQRWLYGLSAVSGSSALGDLQTLAGTSACPSGMCGAASLGSGAPVRDTSVVIPPPAACIPGIDAGCTIPAKGLPPIPDSSLYSACSLVLRAPDAIPIVLPRPCGRQSWRQVR